MIKTDREECERVLANAIQLVKALLIFAYPVMPKSMEKVAETINLDLKNARLEDALKVDEVVELGKPKIPFEKVEDKKIEEMERIMMERIRKAESGEKESENLVDIKDFAKLDIRIGRIIKAERIKGSRKLLRLEVDIGDEIRQIVAGIAETYSPEDLIGKLVPVLVNIKPAKLMGVESRGMILAVDVDGKAVLLQPEREVPVGSKIR